MAAPTLPAVSTACTRIRPPYMVGGPGGPHVQVVVVAGNAVPPAIGVKRSQNSCASKTSTRSVPEPDTVHWMSWGTPTYSWSPDGELMATPGGTPAFWYRTTS